MSQEHIKMSASESLDQFMSRPPVGISVHEKVKKFVDGDISLLVLRMEREDFWCPAPGLELGWPENAEAVIWATAELAGDSSQEVFDLWKHKIDIYKDHSSYSTSVNMVSTTIRAMTALNLPKEILLDYLRATALKTSGEPREACGWAIEKISPHSNDRLHDACGLQIDLEMISRLAEDPELNADEWDANGQPALVKLMLKGPVGDKTLEAVKLIVENCKADVNAEDEGGNTPLHYACLRHPNIVKYLLTKGANPSAVASDGYTPMRFARQRGDLDVIDLLREFGDTTPPDEREEFLRNPESTNEKKERNDIRPMGKKKWWQFWK